ncbi:MAG: hypothetical protein DMG71_10420 [Acidobacteria bacterium]|nr:MAG: hypothetical protein DMG71_10420 [Acidobacteriota bacterium]
MKTLACCLILCCAVIRPTAQENLAPADAETSATLQKRVTELESEVQELKKVVRQLRSGTQPEASAPAPAASLQQDKSAAADDRSKLDFFPGTTVNLNLDGYYGYNFNRPIGRVNLLRAYDVTSNSFSLNQADLVVEHAPDVAAGNRFGARLDLQFGQATETLQGSAVNENRPQVYRPLFQAYGTYVFPVGSGLTVDFGKWASAMGIENNYTKDQINYSRSYFFNFLPFYHMGVRATYQFSDAVSLTYAVVNGVQQTEDFNGFKSQMMFLTLHPKKTVSWNINYHGGQEQRDAVTALNPGFPIGATQPGLPAAPISPTPNGWLQIFDSYVTRTATPKLTLAAEGDYVINRVFSHSSPTHVEGGAGYVRYQFTPKVALATRAEYLSDHGGLFSGVTQALKETTLTYEYKFAEGFLMRTEWRRDFSNVPFFRTDAPGILKKEQNTATVGLVWWFGRKKGPW